MVSHVARRGFYAFLTRCPFLRVGRNYSTVRYLPWAYTGYQRACSDGFLNLGPWSRYLDNGPWAVRVAPEPFVEPVYFILNLLLKHSGFLYSASLLNFSTMEMHAKLTAHPPRPGGGEMTSRSILGICRRETEPVPQDLEDDLDPRPTAANSDAGTYPDSGQTDDQRRRMGSQGPVARLCHEEHQRNQGC